MEQIFKHLNLEERGINIDGEWLTDLRFADDVALTSPSGKDLEVQLNSLNTESKKIGLKNFDTREPIEIDNEPIEKADSYKYLGKTVKMEDNIRDEVLLRIKAGCCGVALADTKTSFAIKSYQ
ncbi:uncharacterized protein [Amphiura filiformis]|uniref:uncharacterized protein n=1 Tax=Amphiura filiformis TaxID=82378 RepID=UPI003B21EE01